VFRFSTNSVLFFSFLDVNWFSSMDITEKQSEMYGSLTKCESFKSE
jgi:hypothetical protein